MIIMQKKKPVEKGTKKTNIKNIIFLSGSQFVYGKYILSSNYRVYRQISTSSYWCAEMLS